MFETYTPQQLRDAIEIELQHDENPKTAAITAMKRLKEDPEYYVKKYGVLAMSKARLTKYIRRAPDGKGGWKYWYKEDVKKQGNIKVKGISDIKGIFDFFNEIGFSPLVGEHKINKESITKSFEISEKIKNVKKNEICYSINNGSVNFNKKGTVDDILLTKEDVNRIRKSEIFIHNHTADKTLSCNDIMIAASSGIKKIIAVFENKKYSMSISLKEESKNNQEESQKMYILAKGLASSYLESKRELSEKVKNNKITKDEANGNESHLIINKILSNKNINDLFSIKYNKE